MEKKKFIVQIYYTGYCTYEVIAKDDIQAIELARKEKINNDEILSNLEYWHEADSIINLGNEKSKK